MDQNGAPAENHIERSRHVLKVLEGVAEEAGHVVRSLGEIEQVSEVVDEDAVEDQVTAQTDDLS